MKTNDRVIKTRVDEDVRVWKSIEDAISYLSSFLKPDAEKIKKYREILNYFNVINKTSLKETDGKKKQVYARLQTFSVEEIKKAILNRSKDDWATGGSGDGKLWHKDWDSLFRNDDRVDKWLNKEVAKPNVVPVITTTPDLSSFLKSIQ